MACVTYWDHQKTAYQGSLVFQVSIHEQVAIDETCSCVNNNRGYQLATITIAMVLSVFTVDFSDKGQSVNRYCVYRGNYWTAFACV